MPNIVVTWLLVGLAGVAVLPWYGLDRYIATFEQESGEKIDAREFKAFFDLLTIQRKLKDAGRFEFINRVKGNPGFLVSIPASLRYVKAAFARRPELAPLQKLVAKYVPELAA